MPKHSAAMQELYALSMLLCEALSAKLLHRVVRAVTQVGWGRITC